MMNGSRKQKTFIPGKSIPVFKNESKYTGIQENKYNFRCVEYQWILFPQFSFFLLHVYR